MNIFAETAGRIAAALETLKLAGKLPAGSVVPAFAVEPPRDASHGDIACNVAMMLAKPTKMKPRDIADLIAGVLAADTAIAKVEVAGPGFLNITLAASVWHGLVRAIAAQGTNYGRPDFGKGVKVNVEYVSANPTGPMHVGHCRGAVFGDALASLLAFAGYDVTREYYINDAGGQVNTLARSVFLRYREALGETITIPEGFYPGDYLIPVGKALAETHGQALLDKPESAWLTDVRKFATDLMMVEIKNDLLALNIKHDIFFSEASLKHDNIDEVADAIATLKAKGHIHTGRLEKPLGHDADDWEDREQTLFKSTAYGDDTDRALQKSDGSYTYFAGDVAYHHDKLSRDYRHLINIWGADHIGYIHRVLAAVAAFTGGTVPLNAKGKLKDWQSAGGSADLDIRVVSMVNLLKNGEPFKMSKRSGNFVTLRDVVDEVGPDPVRFMMLYRKELEPLDFDLAKVVEQSKENPVFYVQMGHARAKSVFRNVKDVFPDLAEPTAVRGLTDLSGLSDPGELALIKKLAAFPDMIAGAAKAREPHKIAFYLYEVASEFHGHWSRGNDLPHLRFIQANDKKLTAERLALVDAFAQVVACGLSILGVSAPDELR
jgi:arginyl-tRNA synthetase